MDQGHDLAHLDPLAGPFASGLAAATPTPLLSAWTTAAAPLWRRWRALDRLRHFQQTWNGKTATVAVKLNLSSTTRASHHPPPLGLITPWKAYAEAGSSLRGCWKTAALPMPTARWRPTAAPHQLSPARPLRSDNAITWSYQATYHFADLLHYQLYDYAKPEAPEVQNRADDSFELTTANGKELLIVRGRAAGTTLDGRQVELRVDAQLERASRASANVCELGRRLE
jgi:hypothetical protein